MPICSTGIGSVVGAIFAHVQREPLESWITSDRFMMSAEGGAAREAWCTMPRWDTIPAASRAETEPESVRLQTAQKGFGRNKRGLTRRSATGRCRAIQVQTSETAREEEGMRTEECGASGVLFWRHALLGPESGR